MQRQRQQPVNRESKDSDSESEKETEVDENALLSCQLISCKNQGLRDSMEDYPVVSSTAFLISISTKRSFINFLPCTQVMIQSLTKR